MATADVDLNHLITYDLKISFDPLLVALRGKADASSVNDLSATVASQATQLEMLKALLGGGSGGSGGGEGGNEGGGGSMAALMKLMSEVSALKEDRLKDAARIEALEKSLSESQVTGVFGGGGASQGVEELATRVTLLEDELSHILAQISTELAKASGESPSSGAIVASNIPTTTTSPVASASTTTPATTTPPTGASSTETAPTTSSATPAAAAAAAASGSTSTATTTAPPSIEIPSNGAPTAAGQKPAPPPSSSSLTSSSESSPRPEEKVINRPRSSLPRNNSGLASPTGDASSQLGNPTSPVTGDLYAAEIRALGERLQSLVASLVPTNEMAKQARALTDDANAKVTALEARVATLEQQRGPGNGGLSGSSSSTSATTASSSDLSAVDAALAAIREEIKAMKAMNTTLNGNNNGTGGANNNAAAIAAAAAGATITTLTRDVTALSAHVEDVAKKEISDFTTLSAIAGDNSNDLSAQVDALLKTVAKMDGKMITLREDVDGLTGRVNGMAQESANAAKAPKLDEISLAAWAESVTIALTVVTGGADDATNAKKSVPSNSAFSVLASKTNDLATVSRPSAARAEVRAVSSHVSEVDARVKVLEEKPAIVIPEIPAPLDLSPIESSLVGLDTNKADKSDVDARVSSIQETLDSITKRLNEYMKQLSKALNAVKPNTSSGGDHASLSGKQLLRDLKCLSCDQPLAGIATDRGDYAHTFTMTPHVAPNKTYMMNMALGSGGNNNNGQHMQYGSPSSSSHGGGGRSSSPSRPSTSSNMGGGNSGFTVLPNGHVLMRAGVTNGMSMTGGSSATSSTGRPASRGASSPPTTSVPSTGDFEGINEHAARGSVRLPPLSTATNPTSDANVTVVHRRGSGVVIAGSGGAAVAVAPSLVDSRSGTPVQHYYADPNIAPAV